MNDKSNLRTLIETAIKEHQSGSREKAELLYKEILDAIDDHPDANHNLAYLYLEDLKLEKAKYHIDKIIDSNYPMQNYYTTGASIYFQYNLKEEAILILDKAINLFPREIRPRFMKAVIYRDLNQLENAKIVFKDILQIAPNDSDMHNSYGVILAQDNLYQDSIPYFKKALKINKNHADALANLGLAYHKTQEFNLAKDFYYKSLKLRDNHLKTYINLGALYQELGDLDNTISNYKMASELASNNDDKAETINNMGIAYGEFGKTETAADCYRRSLELKPDYYPAFRHLCTTGLIDIDDPIFIRMEKTFKSNIDDNAKLLIGFGLGFVYDKAGDYDKAFKYIKIANELNLKRINYTHDIKIITKEVPLRFPQIIKKDIEHKNNWKPIFIVGMPRSGSSMIEKVLDNNDDVDQMGELITLDNLIARRKVNNVNWPYNISEYESEEIKYISKKYIDIALQINPNLKKIFIDKMPGNFTHVGLIKLSFPDSKIIHIRRNPLDNILSIYMLKFSDAHRYSFDLAHITEYYKNQEKLMGYWKSLFPEDIHTLNYEEFVSNPKDETKKLYSFCKLDYKDGDERFDLNKNITRTASNHQVKQKINKNSLNRWKNYKNEIHTLIEEFDELGA